MTKSKQEGYRIKISQAWLILSTGLFITITSALVNLNLEPLGMFLVGIGIARL